MSQATRRWISEKVQSLRDTQVLPFHDVLNVGMVNDALAAEGVMFHERIYTPLVTLCMFLSQTINRATTRTDSNHEVGDRFGRVEPRANKRRPKPQRFLMVPRPQARKALMATT